MDKTEYVKNMEETIQDIGVEEADKDLKIYKKYETLIRNKKKITNGASPCVNVN